MRYVFFYVACAFKTLSILYGFLLWKGLTFHDLLLEFYNHTLIRLSPPFAAFRLGKYLKLKLQHNPSPVHETRSREVFGIRRSLIQDKDINHRPRDFGPTSQNSSLATDLVQLQIPADFGLSSRNCNESQPGIQDLKKSMGTVAIIMELKHPK